MTKFDLVQKIRLTDLIKGLLNSKRASPFLLVKDGLSLSDSWQENYFNWGRNSLYYLFKSLKYKRITFPAFTCPTLTEAAQKAGKKVILSEIDLGTFNLDIKKIPQNTQCLVVVHTFGNPVNIKAIRNRFKKIFIVEDCAHAIFSRVGNKLVGNRGDVVFFSLYKQIPNINGSLLLTKKKIINQQDQEKILPYLRRVIYKANGLQHFFLNYKRTQYLPNIEPQKLSSKQPSKLVMELFSNSFVNLEREVKERRKIALFYMELTSHSPFILCQKPEIDSLPSYYHFAIRLKPQFSSLREKIVLALRQKKIFVDRLWYEAPIIQAKYKKEQKNCPKALLLAKTVINLPIYGYYNKNDITQLFQILNQTIKDVISNS